MSNYYQAATGGKGRVRDAPGADQRSSRVGADPPMPAHNAQSAHNTKHTSSNHGLSSEGHNAKESAVDLLQTNVFNEKKTN